mgnify:CR=1 FL=1
MVVLGVCQIREKVAEELKSGEKYKAKCSIGEDAGLCWHRELGVLIGEEG